MTQTDPENNSMSEPLAEQLWLDIYRRAVDALASGEPSFNVALAGNRFDMTIMFIRFGKGDLARMAADQPTEPPPAGGV